MRSDIKRAVIVAVLASGIVAAVGCRAGETTEGGRQMSGPSSSPVAVTPRPPTVGGGTVEIAAALEATTTATPEPAALAITPTDNPTPVARLPPPQSSPSAPTPPAAPLEPPAGGDLEAQVRAAVERYFPPAEWTKAMRVAWCESRYQPWAVEPGGAHVGVYQLDPSLHGAVPADIDGQVRQAADLWRLAGWGPWQCQ